jgi:CDP-glucose 4,6-dehydratase
MAMRHGRTGSKNLSQAVNPNFWVGKRVMLTGHTGFKGSWISLWLGVMGANLRGLSLPAAYEPCLFDVARVSQFIQTRFIDIRDFQAVKAEMIAFQPEILIHLAAQPLVRFSYQDPLGTYTTNIIGTLNILEAARVTDSIKVIVNVTSDKCYENDGSWHSFTEAEPMGGDDPYSSSKGCSEIISRAYRTSFLTNRGINLATARAGNVIGGGDWSTDRLVPDVLRSLVTEEPLVIRNPAHVRPWQHVLEPISGYLLLAEKLYLEGSNYAEGWNFGPGKDSEKSVGWVAEFLLNASGKNPSWSVEECQLAEAPCLKLDSSKANNRLNWQPRWCIATALSLTLDWHNKWVARGDMQKECLNQILFYEENQ